MRVSRAVESSLKKMRFVPIRVLVGGFLLGAMILLFPALYGEGYLAMRSMLTDRMGDLFSQSFFSNLGGDSLLLPLLLIALALVKPVATAVTTGSGGIGGTFAPTLFVGCAFGYAFASLCNIAGIANLPPMNFALAGMAGALSGIMAAPLTGVFLIAELTGGYELFIPLIVVSSVSTMLARHFEPFSIYTRGLGKSGRLITHHKDRAALTLLQTKYLIDTDFACVAAESDLSDLSFLFVRHPSSCYPVNDKSGQYLGFVCSKEIVSVLSDPELRDKMILEDLIHDSRTRLDVSMDAISFFEAFERSDDDELPVFDNGKLMGIVTRKKLYAAYRAKVAELSDGNEP
jgi:CIC family chloride channel protein